MNTRKGNKMAANLAETRGNNSSHTPGPWYSREVYGKKLPPSLKERISPDHWEVTEDNPRGGGMPILVCRAEAEANARLIAAAPEMFEALESLYWFVSSEGVSVPDDKYHLVLNAHAVLAKATGGKP